MKNAVDQAFDNLFTELLLAMASDYTSMENAQLYYKLSTVIENARDEYGQAIAKVGKEKTALGATNTESGLQKESITKYITIIVNDKDRLPPQAQQFTENFLKMTNAICELQKEYK